MGNSNLLKEFYGTGIMALKRRPMKIYPSLESVKKAAMDCGVNFVVEFFSTSVFEEEKNIRQFLAWSFNIKTREQLFIDYNRCGEKLSVLRGCQKPYWLELTTSSGNNYIIPIGSDISEKSVEKLNQKSFFWFNIKEVNGKNYIYVDVELL